MGEDDMPDPTTPYGPRPRQVPPVSGVPERDRVDLGPAGSLRQARERHRQLTKPTVEAFARSWRLLLSGALAGVAVLLAVYAIVAGTHTPATLAAVLRVDAMLTLAMTLWVTYHHDE